MRGVRTLAAGALVACVLGVTAAAPAFAQLGGSFTPAPGPPPSNYAAPLIEADFYSGLHCSRDGAFLGFTSYDNLNHLSRDVTLPAGTRSVLLTTTDREEAVGTVDGYDPLCLNVSAAAAVPAPAQNEVEDMPVWVPPAAAVFVALLLVWISWRGRSLARKHQ